MIFQREVKFPNVPLSAARSLSQMDLDRPNIQAVIESAKKLKIKYESPICVGVAVAHIGFQKHKIAVWGNSTGRDRRLFMERQEKWKKIGWELVGLPPNAGSDPAALRKELSELLGLK